MRTRSEGSTKSPGAILDSARWRVRAPAMDGKAQSFPYAQQKFAQLSTNNPHKGSTKSPGAILDSIRWCERAPSTDGKAQSLPLRQNKKPDFKSGFLF